MIQHETIKGANSVKGLKRSIKALKLYFNVSTNKKMFCIFDNIRVVLQPLSKTKEKKYFLKNRNFINQIHLHNKISRSYDRF